MVAKRFSALSLVVLLPACRFDYELFEDGHAQSMGGNLSTPVGPNGALLDDGVSVDPSVDGSDTGLGGAANVGSSTGAGGTDGPGGGPVAPAFACGTQEILTPIWSSVAPPVVGCGPVGTLVCEDFEQGQREHWSLGVAPLSAVTLQDCQVHGGSRALMTYAANSGEMAWTQLSQPLVPAVGSGKLYIRDFVYLPAAQVLSDWTVLWEIWDRPDSAENKISLDVLPDGSMNINNSSPKQSGRSTYFGTGAVTLPRDTWVCVETEIVVSSSNGSVRLYMNDLEIAATTSEVSTRAENPFNTAIVGLVVASGELGLYHDDFVIAPTRIGCN